MTQRVLHLAAVSRKPHGDDFDQRVLRYRDRLAERGIAVEPMELPKGFLAKRRLIRQLQAFDGVWWHRHRLTWPHLGWLRATGRCIVYDFDDPVVFASRPGQEQSRTRRRRFAAMLRHCDAVCAGNQYLAELARPHAQRVERVPMAIDPPSDVSAERPADGETRLLWLGSPATQDYLESVRPVLEQLGERRRDVCLRLVAHRPMTFGALRVAYRPWSPQQQEQALRQCHIGLCPMPDTIWTRGKCPFKVIQYMAYGMPWIGSGVGENLQSAGNPPARGLCADDPEQWLGGIERLLDDPAQRVAMGRSGMAYVGENHDRAALAGRLAELWLNLAGSAGGKRSTD